MDPRYYNSKRDFRNEREAEEYVTEQIEARKSKIKKVYK